MSDLLGDVELAAFVAGLGDTGVPSCRELGPEAVRAAQRDRVRARPPGPEVELVEDSTVVGGIGVRLYRPRLETGSLVVFVHGGMWTIGDLDSHDRVCRRLAVAADTAVLAVDFRRAPEHPWPAAIDDVVAVVRWAQGHRTELTGGGGPLVLMGDSSGGNLVALACLRLRDEGGPVPDGQVLVCPDTDLTLSQPSITEKADGWGLAVDDVAWGAELWVPDPTLRADPRVSPLYAPDLAGLPPTLLVTAEHDPLRDEGEAYAARLAAAGVPLRHRRETGTVHGFLTLDTASPAMARAGDRLFADVAQMTAGEPGLSGAAPSSFWP